MKRLIVFLLVFLSGFSVYSQDVSGGMRIGASMWNNADAGLNIINPEAGLFVRAEPIKRLSIDLGFSAYKLKRTFSREDVSHSMGCKELNVAAQFNYLRLFKKTLKLYAGLDYSHIFSSLEVKSISNPGQPVLSPYINSSSFRFHMVGINQSVTLLLSQKITAIATFSYKGNISELNSVQIVPGYTRYSVQGGVS